MTKAPESAKCQNEKWWAGGSVYQIYPRSFFDTNGDGVGDIKGISSKLKYIKGLNVDAIWVCPFYESPMVDFGYDVSNYRKIDPLFGDLEDLKKLLIEAKKIGLKVIVDLVLSHTSEKHEWFVKSCAEPNSIYGDYYVWHEGDKEPNNWLSVFGGSAWTYHEGRQAYYLHNFLKEQPDLNLHNPLVQNELMDVARFWLELGVDGFRLDACNMYFHHLSLKDNPTIGTDGSDQNKIIDDVQDESNPYFAQVHLYDKSQPDNIAFLEKLRSVVDEYDSKYLIGEIFCERVEETTNNYSKNGYPLHSAYNFSLLVNRRTDGLLSENILKFYKISPETTWSFSNHDVVRVVSRWQDNHSTITRAKAYNTILSGLPGTIILYQGEELGLEEATLEKKYQFDPFGSNIDSPYPGRDGCRTPIPWDKDDPNGGFSAGKPWLPITEQHLASAVSCQMNDAESVLTHTRRLLQLRSESKVARLGDIEFLRDQGGVIIYRRRYEGITLIYGLNLSDTVHDQPIESGLELLGQLSDVSSIIEVKDKYFLRVGPGGFAVLKN